MSTNRAQSWADDAHEVFDKAGYRRGAARAAIIDVLARQECALTAQEIEDELRNGARSVGRASIYRVLEMLVQYGLAQRLELAEGVTRYEPVDSAGEHHHHLVCRRCGRLAPFEDQGLEYSIDRLTERLNFEVDEHEVVLRGSCQYCANA